MSTPSAPASTIVAATKWRQHVAVDVSPQNRFALKIKPRSGDRKDRCRHFVAFEFCAVIFCGLTSTAIRCRHYRGWYAEDKARSQQSEAYRNHPTKAKLITAIRPSQRCGTARFPSLNSAMSPRREGDFKKQYPDAVKRCRNFQKYTWALCACPSAHKTL